MTTDEARAIRIECTTCGYVRTVYPTDDELPADVIVEHGRLTGHKLTTADVDADERERRRG